MVSVALRALAEENGSTESSISAYIRSSFNDLPWGHDRLLPYYLRKLVADNELTSPSPDRYQLPFHLLPSVRRRGRPRLYPQNPNPRLNPRSSAPRRQRDRSQPRRRRGRPPKIRAEDGPPIHLEPGTPPPRRGRGRSRFRRGYSTGRTATRRLRFRIPRSRSPKMKQDSILVSNTVELSCQSGDSACFNDIKNGGSECGVLEDPGHIELGQVQLEEGRQPFVVSEQSEVVKGQFLEEEQPLLIPEPGTTMPPFLASAHAEGQSPQIEKPPLVALEQIELSQSFLGEEPPLLTLEQGKQLPFLVPRLGEHDQGQSMQEEEEQPFMHPEQTDFVQVQSSPRESPPFFNPETRKLLPFLDPELYEHDRGQPPQGEAPPLMPPDFIELAQKQSSEEPPLLYSEQSEHGHGLHVGTPEDCEDSHEQRLPAVEAADPEEGELVLMPHPNEEAMDNATVSSKKRKWNERRRSKRLWFES